MVLVLSSSLKILTLDDQQETDPKQAAILTRRCTNSDFTLCGAGAERIIFGYTTVAVLYE